MVSIHDLLPTGGAVSKPSAGSGAENVGTNHPAPKRGRGISQVSKIGLDHSALCKIAKRWLKYADCRGGHGCQVVLDEGRAGQMGGESPDTIGFRTTGEGDGSYLIECKVSRADFLADRHKPHRRIPAHGMGKYRYYMCPEGLIEVAEVPERWGLLWVTRRGSVRVMAGAASLFRHNGGDHFNPGDVLLEPWSHSYNAPMECALLASLLNRVGDADKLNAMLRESSRREQTMVRELQKLRVQIQQQQRTILELKYGEGRGETRKAIPRATAL